jgi:hypothetical protein
MRPVVLRLLATETPDALAARLVAGSQLADPAVRLQLWNGGQAALDVSTDIVGGNSGSPLLAADGRIVGPLFDGNIHSISGAYWFDAEKNRAVAVHPAIIREALRKVYRNEALLTELGAAE